MKCQKCGKNEANTHITKIVNGNKTELYLCPYCSGAVQEMSGSKPNFDKEFENLFSGFFSMPHVGNLGFEKDPSPIVCPICNTSANEIMSQGKPGCTNCYKVFASFFSRPLKQIHGSDRHIGKTPLKHEKEIKSTISVELLKSELERAVSEQNFEKAAELRDKIKDFTSKQERGDI